MVNERKAATKLTAKQRKWVENFKASLDEVDLHLHGKIKLKTAEQLLNEL